MQVYATLFLELCSEIFNKPHVKVFTAEKRITVGGQHLELVLAIDFGNLDNGDIKSTATQVVNRDSVIAFTLIHTIRQRCCRRFVDNALHV